MKEERRRGEGEKEGDLNGMRKIVRSRVKRVWINQVFGGIQFGEKKSEDLFFSPLSPHERT